MNMQAAVRAAVVLLFLGLTGCGDSIGHTVPVKGKVTVDGKALSKGSVTFWPNKEKGNNSQHEAGGQISEDGSYEVYTKGKAGIPPGHYKVTVVAQTDADNTAPTKVKLLVPQKYTKAETTPLLIEVVENPASGAYNLDVK
jgi:hypothetical protein